MGVGGTEAPPFQHGLLGTLAYTTYHCLSPADWPSWSSSKDGASIHHGLLCSRHQFRAWLKSRRWRSKRIVHNDVED